MVAGLGLAAGGLVDHAAGGAGHQFITEIDVIDPPAPIHLPAATAVVPPTPMAGIGLKQPESILEPISEQNRQGFPFGLAGHDFAGEAIGIMQVASLGADVEISQHAERIALQLLPLQVAMQAGQPGQFVLVFLAIQGVAVGYVEIEHPYAFHQGTDHSLLAA